jgi:hypothetical protein
LRDYRAGRLFAGEGECAMPPLQRDFTQGSIPRHLIMFSLPMFLGNLLQGLYSTVDSIWVGRFLGADALGAVSVSMPIVFGLISLVMGLAVATTTMVAQYRGARQEETVRRTEVDGFVKTRKRHSVSYTHPPSCGWYAPFPPPRGRENVRLVCPVFPH